MSWVADTKESTGIWIIHAIPIAHPVSPDGSNCDLVSRHSLDMKITNLSQRFFLEKFPNLIYFISYSFRFVEIMGYPKKQMLGTSWFKYIYPEDLEKFCANLKECKFFRSFFISNKFPKISFSFQ